MRNTAIIYARQSSGDEENSGSITQQIDLCYEKAKQLKIEVVAVFQDPNISGKTYPTIWRDIAKQDEDFCKWCKAQKRQKQFRDGVSEAIQFSQDNQIKYWFVIDSTRIHRSTENSFLANKFNQFFVNNHIEIVQVKGEKIDLSMFDQALINQIRTAINDEQIRKSKEKSMQRIQQMKSEGVLTNSLYLGMSKIGQCKYAWNEDIEIVKYAFTEYAKGEGLFKVCKNINQKFDRYKDKMLTDRSLIRLLQHTVYINKMYVNDQLIDITNAPEGAAPIDEHLFWSVQEILKGKKHTRISKDNIFLPLSGKIFCGECGRRLVVIVNKQKQRHYKCIAHDYHKCDLSVRIVNDIDNGLLHGLIQVIAPLCINELKNTVRAAMNDNKQNELSELQYTKSNMQAKLKKLVAIFTDYDDDSIIEQLTSLKQQIKDIDHKINTLQIAINNTDDVDVERKAITELVLQGELTDKVLYQRIINKTIKSIIVNKNESIQITTNNNIQFDLPIIHRRRGKTGQCAKGLPIYSVSVTDDKVTILYHLSDKTLDLPYDELTKTVLFADEHTEICLVG